MANVELLFQETNCSAGTDSKYRGYFFPPLVCDVKTIQETQQKQQGEEALLSWEGLGHEPFPLACSSGELFFPME